MDKANDKILTKDLHNLIILTIGFICLIVGVIMLFENIKADGTIDFKFYQISGKIVSPNAGLFLIFSGVFLIVVSKCNFTFNKKT